MPWLGDAVDAIAWLASESFTGGSAQQVAQGIAGEANFGNDASSLGSWYLWYLHQLGSTLSQATPGQSTQNLWQWLSTAPSQQQQQTSQPVANQAGATGGIQGFSGDPNVVNAIIKAAHDSGVDPRLALAIAQHESNFNPTASGDGGCSKGVFQLNTCTGEGVGKPDYVLNDPYSNAMVALAEVRRVQQANPGMPEAQIAEQAQRADNTNNQYVNAIQQNLDSIATGQGTLSWANTYLQNPQLGGLGGFANQAGGSNAVPLPFSSGYFQDITERFGETEGGLTEMGTDFGMPVNTTIYTPVGGTIQLRDDGKANWGKAVYVKMPNGWTYFVGHMHSFSVSDGEKVSPGSVLGVSGGDPRDPSSGNSTGPHVEVRFIDPNGTSVDPMPFLQQIFSGTTFATLAGGAFLSSAQIQGQAQDIHVTPDGQTVDFNTPDGTWYKTVDSIWSSVYGQHAPLQAALDFKASGVTTVDALQLTINNLPSNIPGVTIGQYKTVSDAAQKQAQQSLGRAVPQSLVQEFLQQGITTSSDIKAWFDFHDSSQVPAGTYQQIFDSSAAYTQSLYGDVPHPNDVAQIYQNAGGNINPNTGSPDPITKTIQDYTAGVF